MVDEVPSSTIRGVLGDKTLPYQETVITGRNTRAYNNLEAEWIKYMASSGYDLNITTLLKLRKIRPRHKIKVSSGYSKGIYDILPDLMGLALAKYEIGAAQAIPQLDCMAEVECAGGIEPEDYHRVAFKPVMGYGYSGEFLKTIVNQEVDLEERLSGLNTTELNVLDWIIRKSPLYPLIWDIMENVADNKEHSPVLAPIYTEPTQDEFEEIVDMVFKDGDTLSKIRLE
jgi:uncharacterized protein YaaR (DUF327 family)